ncbi:hypothetical protein RNZ50_03025 [Paracoccaceae bacterium Fryx2]|nr:hypothetical protein [Paracoccaceae bacterium Fryx2]
MTRRAFVAWVIVLTLVCVWGAGPRAHLSAPMMAGQLAALGAATSPDLAAVQVKPGLVQRAADERPATGPHLALPGADFGATPERVMSADGVAPDWTLPPDRRPRLPEPRAPPAA